VDKKLPVIGAFFMALVFLHAPGFAQTKDTGITIRQSAYFKVPPEQVYGILLSSADYRNAMTKYFQ
jgi:hypothetical protein